MRGASRFVVWEGLDSPRAEACEIRWQDDGLVAAGTQVGTEPLPYRLDYALDARHGFRTNLLEAIATGDGWARRITLARDSGGHWTCERETLGAVNLPAPGGATADLTAATDCDLGLFAGFTADLRLDGDGLVTGYPGLAAMAGPAADD